MNLVDWIDVLCIHEMHTFILPKIRLISIKLMPPVKPKIDNVYFAGLVFYDKLNSKFGEFKIRPYGSVTTYMFISVMRRVVFI